MNAVAFHEPKKLSRYEIAWRSKATAPPVTKKGSESLAEIHARSIAEGDEILREYYADLEKRPVS